MRNERYQLHEIALLLSLMIFTMVYMIWGVLELVHFQPVVDEPTPEVTVTMEAEKDEIDIFEPVEPEVIKPEPEPEGVVEYPQLWTEKDAYALARMLWGEALGVGVFETWDGRMVSGDAQRAACIWTVLNRYDAGFEDSIFEVVTAYDQYHGYKRSHPVDEELLALTYDVLDRWNREKHGEVNVGRTLPPDYYWFVGDGDHNWFTNEYRSKDYWEWEYKDVYAWTLE